MIVKLSSRNQITLPREALDAMGDVTLFYVVVDGDTLVLTPARSEPSDTADDAVCAAWAGKFR
jgi:hypothetical protein